MTLFDLLTHYSVSYDQIDTVKIIEEIEITSEVQVYIPLTLTIVLIQ